MSNNTDTLLREFELKHAYGNQYRSGEFIADLRELLDKLMPTEENFNEAVKANLPLLIRAAKGKLQYPYVSGHAHSEIEKHLGHELFEWFRNRMKEGDK